MFLPEVGSPVFVGPVYNPMTGTDTLGLSVRDRISIYNINSGKLIIYSYINIM